MPSARFFQHAGLFLIPAFLESEFIADLCTAMTAAPAEKALVEKVGGINCLDENVRKTESILVPEEIGAELKNRFVRLVPQLENHFKVRLGGCETPTFLIYRTTDFFAPHADGGDSSRHSDELGRRRVSAVIFLNRESAEPVEGEYGQGELRFYGLLDGPHWEGCGFSLRPEPGLLIAFPSQMLHEVTAVSHGQRLTVVTWFYALEPEKSETIDPGN